jgi:hypothetical protein
VFFGSIKKKVAAVSFEEKTVSRPEMENRSETRVGRRSSVRWNASAVALCVFAHVVMPEHVHLLTGEPQRETLADALLAKALL